MKKIAGVLILLVAFYACKKERHCNCTVTSTGVKTTRYQSPATTVSLTIPLPFEFPIPPVELSPAKDQTSSSSYYVVSTEKVTYEKIKKSHMKKVCQPDFKEKFSESDQDVVSGTYTITSTTEGERQYNCEIE